MRHRRQDRLRGVTPPSHGGNQKADLNHLGIHTTTARGACCREAVIGGVRLVDFQASPKSISHQPKHNSRVTLYCPEERLRKFATDRLYGNWETMRGLHKAFLMQASDVEITKQYSTELRGMAEYYKLANNFAKALWKLQFLWRQSYLKTLAAKHDTSVQKMVDTLNRGSYLAVRVYGKSGEIRHEEKLFDLKSIDREKKSGDEVDSLPLVAQYTVRTELQKRREARQCEYCEKEEGYHEVHHIRKLADIAKGKAPWEKLMIARRRKTLVLCIECHDRLHAGTLPDRRFLLKE